MFYIYAYLRSKDSATAKAGTPYYIGKGKEYRARDSRHNGIRLPKDKQFIVFLETNLTEIGAFALERRYIRWYGRKDLGTGILLNRTDGGEGSTGAIRTEEQKSRISKSLKGHKVTKDSRRKISQNSIGKIVSLETRNKISKSLLGRISPNKGNILSEESKDKIRNFQKGRVRSESMKAKLRIEKDLIECPYCLLIGGKPAMMRWHFNNCKEYK